jgi:hypothetical protein
MTEDAKKVWKVMETDFGWMNQPEDFHLEYFEDIVKATKKALTIPDVVGSYSQEEIEAAYNKGLEDGYACMPNNI